MQVKALLSALLICLSFNARGWDGYDWDRGTYVEIDKGNLVRRGSDIEVYDWGTGEYRDYEVESIRSRGSGAEVEVYDSDTGEYRTFDMD